MITIKRNKTELKVSKEAFKLYYEGIGFKEVGVKAEKPTAKPVDEKPAEKPVENSEEASETPNNENPKKK